MRISYYRRIGRSWCRSCSIQLIRLRRLCLSYFGCRRPDEKISHRVREAFVTVSVNGDKVIHTVRSICLPALFAQSSPFFCASLILASSPLYCALSFSASTVTVSISLTARGKSLTDSRLSSARAVYRHRLDTGSSPRHLQRRDHPIAEFCDQTLCFRCVSDGINRPRLAKGENIASTDFA